MTKLLLAAFLFTGLAACAVEPPAPAPTDELSTTDDGAAIPSVAGCSLWQSFWDCNGDGQEDGAGYSSNPLQASKLGKADCMTNCPAGHCVALGPVKCAD